MTWLNQMAHPQTSSLREKMVLFWHGHFATQTRFAHALVNQNNLIREHALGSFRDLLHGICKDPAMLFFLNANANRKDSINENFGRELLELFSLGIGHYTYQDVFEVSRAFTGWSFVEHNSFTFFFLLHDEGHKEFLGKVGNWDGEDIVNKGLHTLLLKRYIGSL